MTPRRQSGTTYDEAGRDRPTANERGARRGGEVERGCLRRAAFRSRATGAVVETGAWHDIMRLPGGLDADLDEWQAGFVDTAGRFLDRREAAARAGYAGHLEARAWFSGDAEPTLEAGHLEAWRLRRPG